LLGEVVAEEHLDMKCKVGCRRHMLDALARGEFEIVERLGHSMRGSGAGFGFQGITDIGAALERAAVSADAELRAVREQPVDVPGPRCACIEGDARRFFARGRCCPEQDDPGTRLIASELAAFGSSPCWPKLNGSPVV